MERATAQNVSNGSHCVRFKLSVFRFSHNFPPHERTKDVMVAIAGAIQRWRTAVTTRFYNAYDVLVALWRQAESLVEHRNQLVERRKAA